MQVGQNLRQDLCGRFMLVARSSSKSTRRKTRTVREVDQLNAVGPRVVGNLEAQNRAGVGAGRRQDGGGILVLGDALASDGNVGDSGSCGGADLGETQPTKGLVEVVDIEAADKGGCWSSISGLCV